MHIPLQTILLFHSPFEFLLHNHPVTKTNSKYTRIEEYASIYHVAAADISLIYN